MVHQTRTDFANRTSAYLAAPPLSAAYDRTLIPPRVLPLLGIAIVVVGFALRLNPFAVVVTAAIATGLAAHHSIVDVIAAFGKAFVDSRSVAVVWLALPVIGLLESAGLKEQARIVISKIRAATTGRLLLAYLGVRQLFSALGLVSLGGHPQMVRPLIAPMAEGAAENRFGALSIATRRRIRAHAAAADNIGLFFGEDIFIAIGSILLIRSFLDQNSIHVQPQDLAVWSIPTAVAAFIIHGVRLLLLDRSLARARHPEVPERSEGSEGPLNAEEKFASSSSSSSSSSSAHRGPSDAARPRDDGDA